jgi:hypothetical protein
MPNHRKVGPLTDAAFRLHVTAACWCVNEELDGKIPANIPGTLTAAPRGKALERIVTELLDAGLWDAAEEGGYLIHDFLDYNPSAAHSKAVREAKASAGAAGGKAKASGGHSKNLPGASPGAKQPPGKEEANGQHDAKQKPSPTPISDSDSDSQDSDPPPGSRTRGPDRFAQSFESRIPDAFDVTEEHRKLCETRGLDLENELGKHRAWAKSHARTCIDWPADFELWLRGSKRQSGNGQPRADGSRIPFNETPAERRTRQQLERIAMLEAEEAREKAAAP